MGVDSIDKLRGSFDELRALLSDDDAFRDYYNFCFGFAKEPGYGVRTLRTPPPCCPPRPTVDRRPVAPWRVAKTIRAANAPTLRAPPNAFCSQRSRWRCRCGS